MERNQAYQYQSIQVDFEKKHSRGNWFIDANLLQLATNVNRTQHDLQAAETLLNISSRLTMLPHSLRSVLHHRHFDSNFYSLRNVQ